MTPLSAITPVQSKHGSTRGCSQGTASGGGCTAEPRVVVLHGSVRCVLKCRCSTLERTAERGPLELVTVGPVNAKRGTPPPDFAAQIMDAVRAGTGLAPGDWGGGVNAQLRGIALRGRRLLSPGPGTPHRTAGSFLPLPGTRKHLVRPMRVHVGVAPGHPDRGVVAQAPRAAASRQPVLWRQMPGGTDESLVIEARCMLPHTAHQGGPQ